MPVRRKKGKKATPKKLCLYKMPPPFPIGEVINDPSGKKWRIGPSIGVGGFGEIYSACEHENSPEGETNYPFVIKIEPYENGPLFVEMHFYIRNSKKENIEEFLASRNLSRVGMPAFHGTGDHWYQGEQFRFIVLDRYGTDLKKVFLEAGAFKAPTVFQLGLQMLDVMDYIHSRGYVHADLKGANILMGIKEGTENQAYLVDFGLASRLDDEEPFNPDPRCAHNGTIEYTSCDAHLGEPTMRGDLEILAYNMLHWVEGALPWEPHTEKPHKVHLMKKDLLKNARTRITEAYPDVPDALIQFFEYITTLEPKDRPDYTKCKQIFENYLNTVGTTRSSKLDFTPSGKTPKPKPVSEQVQKDAKKAQSVKSVDEELENDTEESPSAPAPVEKENGSKKPRKSKSASVEIENEDKKPRRTNSAPVEFENLGKRARKARKAAPVESEDDVSDDDKPLKPSSGTPKGRKRKSNPKVSEKNDANEKKAKESPSMRLIDNPRVRGLRNWTKRDKLIRALQ